MSERTPSPAGDPGRSHAGPSEFGRLVRLAAPAALTYLLSSAYRVNDQFWIQGLGRDAQSAMAAATFVAIANFALPFLAAAGALSLVSRAVGAGDEAFAQRASRHALGLAFVLGVAVALVAPALARPLAEVLALTGDTADAFVDYLGALFATAPVLFVVPVLDHVFIGRGRTVAPMVLQLLAVGTNFVFNPLAIYGADTTGSMPDAPFGAGYDALGAALDVEALGIGGLGMSGAAWATGASRGLALVVGLLWLARTSGTSLRPRLAFDRALIARIVRISTPVSLSVALYALVYWALFAFVLSGLADEVKAGLGVGFLVLEGAAFPTYLGLSMAAGSLVGNAIGARDPARLERVLRVSTRTSGAAGLLFTVLFWLVADAVAARFTEDPLVHDQIVLYAHVIAVSQFFVAYETLWEKVLMASGRTRAIAWITGFGNGMRVPLAALAVHTFGWGAAGVWWVINFTTVCKSVALWRVASAEEWKRGEGG